MYFVDIGDKFSLWRVPGLLPAGPQLHLDVEELYFQVTALGVPA